MKKYIFIVFTLFFSLTSFYLLKPVSKIYIQPLGEVSPKYINLMKESVKKFYGFDCVVLPKKVINKSMLSQKKLRIDANKALLGNLSFDNLYNPPLGSFTFHEAQ